MICVCQICNELLHAREVSTPSIKPGAGQQTIGSDADPALVARAQLDLQNFDLLAQVMYKHIAERHREHAEQMTAVMHLAAKVYAMTHAASSRPEFEILREGWRRGILDGAVPGLCGRACGRIDIISLGPIRARLRIVIEERSKESFDLSAMFRIPHKRPGFRVHGGERYQPGDTARLVQEFVDFTPAGDEVQRYPA